MSYDNRQIGLYSQSGVEDEYEIVSGVFALPVALSDAEVEAGTAPVTFVRAHPSFRTKTVRFAMKKQNSPPRVPKPVDSGPFTFIGGTLLVPAPTINLNAGFEWTVAGEYFFVSSVANGEDDGYILTTLPLIYPTQIESQGLAQDAANAPADVQDAGIGPKVGWVKGQQLDLTSPTYTYNEVSYLPTVFFSETLVAGTDSYSTLS